MIVKVKPYKRKIKGKVVSIKGHKRNQRSNRGSKGKLRSLKGTPTFWLKDKQGHFVGRANVKSKTLPARVFSKGKDTTSSLQEGKEGRILGRYKAS